MLDTWPIHTLVPRDPRWGFSGGVIQGGRTASGPPKLTSVQGGPLWVATHGGVWVHTIDQVLVARALEGISDGGQTRFIVPSCELRYAPGSPEHVSGEIVAPAALRATTLQISVAGLTPRNDFSIEHATKGHRRYRIIRVSEFSAGVATVSIRPPLREAVAGGEVIEFTHPKCVMQLLNADDFLGALQSGRFSDANPTFMEAF